MSKVHPISDLQNSDLTHLAGTDQVEVKLDEADEAAAMAKVYYSAEELFTRVRRRVHEGAIMQAMRRHRDEIYEAEMGRLNGDEGYTPKALDERIGELFHTHEEGKEQSADCD